MALDLVMWRLRNMHTFGRPWRELPYGGAGGGG